MRSILAIPFLVLLTSPALAHGGDAPASGLASGFLHPLGGIDHVLAMVSVGAIAGLVGGRGRWLVPLSFVAVMVLGAVLGASGIALPMVETAIVASVVVLGAVTAAGRSVPMVAAVALAAVFSVFHGHAHGGEMPATVSGIGYGAGFVAATALLHGAGLTLSAMLARHVPGAMRLAGAAVATAGLALAGGVL